MIGDNMKKEKMGKGSVIILTILLIAILFVTVIGATFAYFSINVKYVNTPSNVVIESNTLVVEFDTTNSINYINAIPGRPKWESGETPTNQLSFSLSSPVTATYKTGYDVYLNIEENTFETDNVVFYLKANECNRKDDSGSKLGSLSTAKTLIYDYDGTNVTLGVIPAGTLGKYKISSGSVLGGLGCVDKWDFEIWINEVNESQNQDQDKSIKATIEVEPGEVYPLDYKNK